jgi:hypothetical protein
LDTGRQGDASAVRTLLLVATVAAVGSGCGGGGQESAETAATTIAAASAATPAGFTVRAVPHEGFAIAVPRDWRSLDASDALRGAQLQRFKQENPVAAPAIEALGRPNSPIKLLAFDPSEGRFATNVNVLVTRVLARVSFARWTRAETAQLVALKPTHLTKATVRLGPGKAYRLAYRARLTVNGKPRQLALQQYMVKRGPFLYVVTFTTTAERDVRLAPTFEQSARTFRLTG